MTTTSLALKSIGGRGQIQPPMITCPYVQNPPNITSISHRMNDMA